MYSHYQLGLSARWSVYCAVRTAVLYKTDVFIL